jgi:hypothetical protein
MFLKKNKVIKRNGYFQCTFVPIFQNSLALTFDYHNYESVVFTLRDKNVKVYLNYEMGKRNYK